MISQPLSGSLSCRNPRNLRSSYALSLRKQKEGTRKRAPASCSGRLPAAACLLQAGRVFRPVLLNEFSATKQRRYFEKLATASASVLNTSKTVISLVICRTSWNLLPRWQRRNPAPWDLALWWAATSVPSPALSINVTLSILRTIFFFPELMRPFTFSRSALLSSPSTMRPSSATTETPSTSRLVIFNATFVSSSSERGSGGNPRRSRKAYQIRGNRSDES